MSAENDPRGLHEDAMPGEPSEPREADDAGFWLDNYRRLISFEEEILGRMRDLSAREDAAVQTEIQKTNISPMEELIKDFRLRASRWEGATGRGADESRASEDER